MDVGKKAKSQTLRLLERCSLPSAEAIRNIYRPRSNKDGGKPVISGSYLRIFLFVGEIQKTEAQRIGRHGSVSVSAEIIDTRMTTER